MIRLPVRILASAPILWCTLAHTPQASSGASPPQDKAPALNDLSDDKADAVAADLTNPDPAKQQAALRFINEAADKRPRDVRRYLRWKWQKPLMKLQRYDDIERLAMRGMMASLQDGAGCSALQNCRVEALLAAGKYDAALAQAKAFYNVATMAETERAIPLVAEALRQTRGAADADIGRRFTQQQIAAAEAARPATQPGVASDSVLKTIHIDSQPYEANIGELRAMRPSYLNRTRLGNLLLLADRPTEARRAFEEALPLAKTEQLPAAVEGIARAIRAEDGTVARANAYILSLRGKAAAGE
jgi:hypothetical protein